MVSLSQWILRSFTLQSSGIGMVGYAVTERLLAKIVNILLKASDKAASRI